MRISRIYFVLKKPYQKILINSVAHTKKKQTIRKPCVLSHVHTVSIPRFNICKWSLTMSRHIKPYIKSMHNTRTHGNIHNKNNKKRINVDRILFYSLVRFDRLTISMAMVTWRGNHLLLYYYNKFIIYTHFMNCVSIKRMWCNVTHTHSG